MTVVAAVVCVLALIELGWIIDLARENERQRRELDEWESRVPF